MKSKSNFQTKKFILCCTFLFTALSSINIAAAQTPHGVKNIVLVHGAFVDGSGWRPVYDLLTKKGYHVSVAQFPLTSFGADSAAVNRIVNQQNGPCILVGHSYGGAIITVVGNNSLVKGLVYIAAHAPDSGETLSGNGKKYPSLNKSFRKGPDGIDFLVPENFAPEFAADLPRDVADFMGHAQTPTADTTRNIVIINPAWKKKPSWYMVAKSDRIINPDLERMYAKRAGSKTVEIDGASHAVYESRPEDVARLIIDAAENAETNK